MVLIKKINSSAPAIEPFKYDVTRSDLYSDSSGRSAETGTMLLYPIRSGVYKIELEYQGNAAEISAIEQLISGTTFSVEFLYNDSYVTKTMYKGDRVNSYQKIINGVSRQILTVSLIER